MDKNISVLLEDSIMQKGQTAAAGSRILQDFIAPFDAAVAEKLAAAGIPITGRAAAAEFGIPGLFSEPPGDILPVIQAVAGDRTVLALCNDPFGQIRSQAVMNHLSYLRPTYGTVSRYGLIPAAASMDQIGILCADIADGFSLLSRIAGKDDRDGAMYPETSYSYAPADDKIRVAVPKQFRAAAEVPDGSGDNNPSGSRNSSADLVEECGLAAKFELRQIELKYFDLYRQVLYLLSCAEICNNTNRYDGVKFGYRAAEYTGINDLYVKTRSEALGIDTKLAVIMGAWVLSQEYYEPYYEKAMKVRRLIKESVSFDGYDIIALPFTADERLYEQSALFALPALAGLPSITVPAAHGGIHFIANVKREDHLLKAWEVLHHEI